MEKKEEKKEKRGESSLNLKMVEKAWIAVSLYYPPLDKHLKKNPSKPAH